MAMWCILLIFNCLRSYILKNNLQQVSELAASCVQLI